MVGRPVGLSVPREPRVPQEPQPVSVRLAGHQLSGAPLYPAGGFTAQVSAVVQEELEQRQVVATQLPSQEEVGPQSAVEVLDQAAGPHDPLGKPLHGGTDPVITP